MRFLVGISHIDHSSAIQLPNATELIPGSDDQYIIQLQVSHLLHCLNLIRKTLYPDKFSGVFCDYYIRDDLPPGKWARSYTSKDAMHLGE